MRPVVWVGDSKKQLLEFPDNVQDKIGYALERVQAGETTNKIKRLRGFPGVYEIVSDYDRNTYRSVYVANLGDQIYVLHCFQKKSTLGIRTPKKEIDLIRRRLSIAKALAQEEAKMDHEKIEYEIGSGNIFRDLEIPDPEEHRAKCRLVFIIDDIITKRRLRRSKAAKILGIRKSELSDLLDGLFRDFSMTALFSMLEKLNHEIEVIVHQKPADPLPTEPPLSTSTDNPRKDSVTGP